MTRRPFTMETITPYLGRNIRPITKKYSVYSSKKRSPKSGVMLLAAGPSGVVIKNRVSRGLTELSYLALLNQYVLDNGYPCGTTVTLRDLDGRVLSEELPPEGFSLPPEPPPPADIADRFILLKEDLVSMSREQLTDTDTQGILKYIKTIELYINYIMGTQ